MAATKTLLDLLAVRADLTRALLIGNGEHAEEIADEIDVINAEIALCLSAEC